MSEVKRYTAIVRGSSEDETLYGLVSISRGEWQQMVAVASLMKVVSRQWPSMRKMSGWDASVTWFDCIPWMASDDEARRVSQKEIEDQVDEGEWVEVNLDWIDQDSDSRSTACDEIHIDTSSVHFSFYPKHSDTMLETPWLMLEDLNDHFERR